MKSDKLLENQRKHQHRIMFEHILYDEFCPFGWTEDIESIRFTKESSIEDNGIIYKNKQCAEIEFNTKGKMSKISEYHNDELFKEINYDYDNDGKLINSREFYVQSDHRFESIFRYNECGDMIEISYINLSENSTPCNHKNIFTYNRDGNLVQKHRLYYELNSQDRSESWDTYIYNEDGNIVFHLDVLRGGFCCLGKRYLYDNNGNIITIYNNDEFESITSYEYDAEGRVIMESKFMDFSNIESDSETDLDEYDNDECGETEYKNEFEYDERGNVVSCVESVDNKVVGRSEWKIKYRE